MEVVQRPATRGKSKRKQNKHRRAGAATSSSLRHLDIADALPEPPTKPLPVNTDDDALGADAHASADFLGLPRLSNPDADADFDMSVLEPVSRGSAVSAEDLLALMQPMPMPMPESVDPKHAELVPDLLDIVSDSPVANDPVPASVPSPAPSLAPVSNISSYPTLKRRPKLSIFSPEDLSPDVSDMSSAPLVSERSNAPGVDAGASGEGAVVHRTHSALTPAKVYQRQKEDADFAVFSTFEPLADKLEDSAPSISPGAVSSEPLRELDVDAPGTAGEREREPEEKGADFVAFSAFPKLDAPPGASSSAPASDAPPIYEDPASAAVELEAESELVQVEVSPAAVPASASASALEGSPSLESVEPTPVVVSAEAVDISPRGSAIIVESSGDISAPGADLASASAPETDVASASASVPAAEVMPASAPGGEVISALAPGVEVISALAPGAEVVSVSAPESESALAPGAEAVSASAPDAVDVLSRSSLEARSKLADMSSAKSVSASESLSLPPMPSENEAKVAEAPDAEVGASLVSPPEYSDPQASEVSQAQMDNASKQKVVADAPVEDAISIQVEEQEVGEIGEVAPAAETRPRAGHLRVASSLPNVPAVVSSAQAKEKLRPAVQAVARPKKLKREMSALEYLDTDLPSEEELASVPQSSLKEYFTASVDKEDLLKSDTVSKAMQISYEKDYREVRAWFERRSQQIGGDFFQYVDAFRAAQFAAEQQNESVDRASQETSNVLNSIWVKEKQQLTKTEKCADGTKVNYTHQFEIAKFNEMTLAKLEEKLKAAMHERVVELTSKRFIEATTYLKVEVYLNDFLTYHRFLTPNSANNANLHFDPSMRANLHQPSDLIASLRYQIDVLFYFEKQEKLRANFRSAIRKWMIYLVDILYRVGTLVDHRYVFQHVVRSHRVSEWAHFVQFSEYETFESPEARDHFLKMFFILMNPVQKSKSPIAKASAPPPSHVTPMSNPESGDWVVLNTEDANRGYFDTDSKDDEDSDGDASKILTLTETDFTTIFEQFPIRRFTLAPFHQAIHVMTHSDDDDDGEPGEFRLDDNAPAFRLAEAQKAAAQNGARSLQHQCDSLSHAFGVARLMRHLLAAGLGNVVEYDNYSKMLAKGISSQADMILSTLSALPPSFRMLRRDFTKSGNNDFHFRSSDAHRSIGGTNDLLSVESGESEPGSTSPRSLSPGGKASHMRSASLHLPGSPRNRTRLKKLVKRELDWLCIRSIALLNEHAHKQAAVRTFLSDFDFQHISQAAAGQVFLTVFLDLTVNDYDNSSEMYQLLTMKRWLGLMESTPSYRARFAEVMVEMNGSLHLLLCLTKLVTQQGGQLPHIFANELFQVAYLDVNTRELLFKQCQELFSTVCDAHPSVVSTVFKLVAENFKFIGRASMPLFKSFDLAKWVPRQVDLRHLKSLLVKAADSHEHQLGALLLESINYSRKAHPPYRPKLKSRIFRSLLIMLADVRIQHLMASVKSGVIFGNKFSTPPLSWWISRVLSIPTHDANSNLLDAPEPKSAVSDFIVRARIPADSGISLADPILSYIDIHTNSHQLDPSEFAAHDWPPIHEMFKHGDATCVDLGYHSLFKLLPAVAVSGNHADEKEDANLAPLRLQKELASPVLPVLFDTTKRRGLFSVFSSKFTTLPRVARATDLICAHVCSVIRPELVRQSPAAKESPSVVGSPVPQGYHASASASASETPRNSDAFVVKIHPRVSVDEAKGGEGAARGAVRRGAPSYDLVRFWMCELTHTSEGTGHEWLKDHNCRYVLDKVVQSIFVAQSVDHTEDGSSAIRAVNSFVDTQARVLFPSGNRAKRLFDPPQSLLGAVVKETEAAKYYPWLTFQVLFNEMTRDREAYMNLGAVLLAGPITTPAKELVKHQEHSKEAVLGKSLIRRWAHYAIHVDAEHPLAPLYWQMFFSLYFTRLDNPMIPKGKGNESGHFGYRLLEGKEGRHVIKNVVDRLFSLAQRFKLKFSTSRLQIHTKLGALYHAMALWLKAGHVPDFVEKVSNGRLNDEYAPARLITLLIEDSIHPSRRNFWWDLVDLTPLQRELAKSVRTYLPDVEWIVPPDPLAADADDEKKAADGKRGARRASGVPDHQRAASVGQMKVPPLVNAEGLTLSIPQCLRLSMAQAVSGNSSKQCTHEVKRGATSYTDRLTLNACLDNQILEHIPNMFRNDEVETRVEKPCNLALQRCNGPAVFVFRHHQCTMINAIRDVVYQSQVQLAQCSQTPDITQEMCGEIIRITKVIKYLIDIPRTSDIEAIGSEWLFDLIDIDSPEIREYPPTRKFLAAAIKSFAHLFIKDNLASQIKLLRTMARHPHLIASLVNSIRPPFSHFVELFRVAATIVNPEKRCVSTVLYKFDLETWLRGSPPLSDRTEMFRICATALREEMSKKKNIVHAEQGEDDVCGTIANILCRVARYNFPELYRPFVSLNMAGSRARQILPSMWETLAGFPLINLSWAHIAETITSISSALWNHRRSLVAHGNQETLYRSWALYIPAQQQFIRRLFENCAPHVIRSPEITQHVWNGLWQVFGPWLSSSLLSPEGGNDAASSIPWKAQDQAHAEIVLKSFVDCIALISTFDESNALQNVWDIYSRELYPRSDSRVIVLVDKALVRLPIWERLPWRIDYGVVASMSDLLSNEQSENKKAGLSQFLSEILNKCDCTRALLDPGEARGTFAIKFLTLVTMLAAELPIPLPFHSKDLFLRLRAFKWPALPLDSYQDLLECVSGVLYGPRWKALAARSAVAPERKEEQHQSIQDMLDGKLFDETLDLADGRTAFILDFMRVVGVVAAAEEAPQFGSFTERLEKIRLFSEWLMSTFRDAGPPLPLCRPINYARTSLRVLDTLSTMVDRVIAGDKDTNALLVDIAEEYLMAINLPDKNIEVPSEILDTIWHVIDTRPLLSSVMLTGSCRTMVSVRTLAVACERCIDAFFAAKQEAHEWEPLLRALEVPEIDEKEFIDSCVQSGSIHTLHATARQKHVAIAQRNSRSDMQRFLVSQSEWIKELDAQAGDHTKLLPLWLSIMSWQIDTVSRMLAEHRSRGGGLGAPVALSLERFRGADLVMGRLAKHIAKCALDKHGWGIMNAVMGHKSKHSAEFRLVARACQLYFTLQSDHKGHYRWSSDVLVPVGTHVDKSHKELADFLKLAESKEYAQQRERVLNLHAFLKNHPNLPLAEYRSVMQHIFYTVFPNQPRLLS